MARFRLIPREERFFTDLSAMADAIAEGAAVFEAILATDFPTVPLSFGVSATYYSDRLSNVVLDPFSGATKLRLVVVSDDG